MFCRVQNLLCAQSEFFAVMNHTVHTIFCLEIFMGNIVFKGSIMLPGNLHRMFESEAKENAYKLLQWRWITFLCDIRV